MASRRVYVDFAEVKRRVGIPEVLTAFGIADRFERKGDKLSGVCPLPQHPHGPYPNPDGFKADLKDGVWLWHCFGDCQRGGDVVELVKFLANLDNSQVRHWFAERYPELGRSKPNGNGKGNSKKQEQPSVTTPPEKKEEAPAEPVKATAEAPSMATSTVPTVSERIKPLSFYLNLSSSTYLTCERGVSPEIIKKYGIGLCSRGYLDGYVAMPIYAHPYEPDTNPIGYVGRWPGEDHNEAEGRPRYKLPKDFPKSRVVYGLRQALDTPAGQPIIVTEGAFKVFYLAQHGYPATVALLGSSLSDEQSAILTSLNRPIVLMLDGDAAGVAGARSAAAKLITRTFVRAVRLEPNEEPDRLSPDRLKQLLSFLA